MKLMRIDSSITGAASASRELTDSFTRAWLGTAPATRVISRDVGQIPVPHLDGQRLAALAADGRDPTPDQEQVIDDSERFISELEQADALVVGMPMYNFHAPSGFKAWFDHVARAGRTFNYTASGPVGLLKDRPVHILATRGGVHEGADSDLQTPWLEQTFALLGIRDLRFVYAEGLNLSDMDRKRAMNRARVLVESAAMTGAECLLEDERIRREAI